MKLTSSTNCSCDFNLKPPVIDFRVFCVIRGHKPCLVLSVFASPWPLYLLRSFGLVDDLYHRRFHFLGNYGQLRHVGQHDEHGLGPNHANPRLPLVLVNRDPAGQGDIHPEIKAEHFVGMGRTAYLENEAFLGLGEALRGEGLFQIINVQGAEAILLRHGLDILRSLGGRFGRSHIISHGFNL